MVVSLYILAYIRHGQLSKRFDRVSGKREKLFFKKKKKWAIFYTIVFAVGIVISWTPEIIEKFLEMLVQNPLFIPGVFAIVLSLMYSFRYIWEGEVRRRYISKIKLLLKKKWK